MKIRKSLLRSYFLAVLLPVLSVVLITGLFALRELRAFRDIYGVGQHDYSMLTNPVEAMNYVLALEYERLCDTVLKDPDAFLLEESLKQYNQSLRAKNGALLIRKNGKIIFDGSKRKRWSEWLPDEDVTLRLKDEEVQTFLVGEQNQIIGRELEFHTSGEENVEAYILMQLSSVLPETRKIFLAVIIGVTGVIVTSGIGLTWFATAKIMSPIKKLRRATTRISQGDLDFHLEVKRDDELGQLCDDFEQMRKRLKEAAEEKINQDKQNKILISNICHDLKTPITSIQGYVEGIMDGVANTPEKQEKYIRTIYNKANEMNTLINELTIYSKLDTNRVPYNFQKLPVVGYFNDYADELKDELEAENVSLSYYNYCNDDVLMIADPEQLSRVIHNIVSNAVKYMNKDVKRINIRVKDVGDFVQVEIEDNGKGIASKDLPYIFERFYRADSSRNETKGSGIGLSIVHKILDDHGGKIWATSKEKIGTTMYFVLRKYQEVPNE